MKETEKKYSRKYKGLEFEIIITYYPEQDMYFVIVANGQYRTLTKVTRKEWGMSPHTKEAVIEMALDTCYTYIENQEAQKN